MHFYDLSPFIGCDLATGGDWQAVKVFTKYINLFNISLLRLFFRFSLLYVESGAVSC